MKFIINRRFEREIQREAAYRAQLERGAKRIERASKALAQANRETGAYLKGFRIAHSTDGVTVGNTDFAAHIIEWGSARQPPQAILRRGTRAAGLRLDETTK